MTVVRIAVVSMRVGAAYALAGAELLSRTLKDWRSAEFVTVARIFSAEVERYAREQRN